MAYAPAKRASKKVRTTINIHQNKFPKGYVSTFPSARRPTDSLADMTNMEIALDNTPRPRAPLAPYGTQPANPITGRGNMRYGGQRSILTIQNVGGVGKLYKQTDGGAFSLIGGSYDVNAWTMFCQSHGRVYIYNGVNNLSYLDLATSSIITYTPLASPVISSITKTGLAGTTYKVYYRVSANNEAGESIASVYATIDVLKIRDAWVVGTDGVSFSWAAVAGAKDYTVYYGDTSTTTNELYTLAGTTFTDDGSIVPNIYKIAPEGNSTAGAIFTFMYNDSKTSQIFGITADNYLYYAAPGTGDMSPYNGGGYVGIDRNGDTQLNFVDGFRTGKGDPALTVSSRGAAGKGRLNHVTFDQLTVGDQIIVFANVFEANGQSGTYAPRATIKNRDSLTYPTGTDFKTTGTSQNIMNILTTTSISQTIEPDVSKITLSALHKAVGLEYRDRLFFALPVGTTENSEIWVLDQSRKNLWILRWTVAAKDMWLYEDNNGQTHHCVLVDNRILEFTRAGAQTTQDDGTPFRTRLAFSSLIWDEDGITMAKIRKMYFKLLYPKGKITINAYGLSKKGLTNAVGQDIFISTTTPTGIGAWDYSGAYRYGDDPGSIETFAKEQDVLEVRPRGMLNSLDWEIITEDADCDYYLSSANTRGTGNPNLIYKGK
jgi:hypothetical protein